MKSSRPVNNHKVSISFNPDSGRLVVRPKTVTIDASERAEILWRCRSANLEIRFDPVETPFRTSRWRCSKGGGCLSGVPKRRRRAEDRLVKYTVTVLPSLNGRADAKANGNGRRPAAAQGCPPRPITKEAFLFLPGKK
jgi:hypothetical protein